MTGFIPMTDEEITAAAAVVIGLRNPLRIPLDPRQGHNRYAIRTDIDSLLVDMAHEKDLRA
jgi:hypothetical protein